MSSTPSWAGPWTRRSNGNNKISYDCTPLIDGSFENYDLGITAYVPGSFDWECQSGGTCDYQFYHWEQYTNQTQYEYDDEIMFICTCEETGMGPSYDECRSNIEYVFPYRYYRHGKGTIFMRLDNAADGAMFWSTDWTLALLRQNRKYDIDLDKIIATYDSVLEYSLWVYLGVGIGSIYMLIALFFKCCIVKNTWKTSGRRTGKTQVASVFRVVVGFAEVITGFMMLMDVGQSATELVDAMITCDGCPYDSSCGNGRVLQDRLLVVSGWEYTFMILFFLPRACTACGIIVDDANGDDSEGVSVFNICELVLNVFFYFLGIGLYFGVWDPTLQSIESTAMYGDFQWEEINDECGYSQTLLNPLGTVHSKVFEMYVFGDLMELLAVVGHCIFDSI